MNPKQKIFLGCLTVIINLLAVYFCSKLDNNGNTDNLGIGACVFMFSILSIVIDAMLIVFLGIAIWDKLGGK